MPSDPPAPFHPTATRRVRHTVRVGVGVVVVTTTNEENHPTLYAGIRKGSHGAGTLALPGGHLEMYESWEDCAVREVREEMNIELTDIQFCHVTNDPMPNEEKHYVTIFLMARTDGVPENMEPDKCEGWESFSWESLQGMMANGEDGESSLFGPLRRLVLENPPSLQRYLEQATATQTSAAGPSIG